MYYIIFPLLYLVSLLPFFILYAISDGIAFLLSDVFKYRKEVVMNNLGIAFPEKTEAERKAIARQFYKYFTDTFIESLKCISISKKQLVKRSSVNVDLLNEMVDKGYSIHVMAGHQFNWEYANLVYSINLKTPFAGIYMPIKNKALDKIFINIRKRYGTILISAVDFKEQVPEVLSRQYVLAMAADQNPGNPSCAYWVNFFGKPTPFVSGPEKGAMKKNVALAYVGFKKVKRGYYKFTTTILATESNCTQPGELTCLYRSMLEKTIREDPANYLWSHRRFKFEWKPEYGAVMETAAV
jgi:KDO2-lipid IV(A) lauroyltransferase